ncbi:MAG: adenylate/guanylate cyclase domain-containing protein [Halioglobus sp.]|nr:adenylate/guanylate cyclase domain-containing protein [Halioglobus sp.]
MKQYLTNHRSRITLGIAFTLIALWLQMSGADSSRTIINRLNYLAYDLRLNLTLPDQPPADSSVIIIDIDEASLRAEGRWPWSREKMGALVTRLKAAGARTIGFDVAFAESERNVARELIEAASLAGNLEHRDYLEQLIPQMDRDQAFAKLLEGQNVVLGFLLHSDEGESVGALPSPWSMISPEQKNSLTLPMMSSYTGNMALLQKAAAHGGFLNTTMDADGVLRSTPLILGWDDMIYPSLSLAMARRHTKSLRFKIDTALAGTSERITGLWLDRSLIPTDQYGRVLIPYSGKRGGIPYISATKIVRATTPDAFPQLENAAVLIGSSALGLSDLVSTPTGPTFPGVEVHATVLQRILSGQPFPRVPDWGNAASALAIALSGLLLAFLCPAFGALAITVFAVGFIGLMIAGDVWLWSSAQIALSPVMPLLTVMSIIAMNVLFGYFAEAKQKRQVRKAFSSYMAPALVDQLVNNPDGLRLTGESREMSFLFSDIAGFTSFTESASPELLVSVLNEYLEAMCHAVMEHGGTIDKIVGDAVVGIFNAPLDQPDHAERAVKCALAMDRISRDFIAKMESRGMAFGITRIGINTGRAIVGNFGGSERFDYTAHGDAINTAARMESVNKHLGTQICIAGSTAAQCPNHFFRPIGALVLKGKTEAIDAFEPISENASGSTLMIRYREAFELLSREDSAAVPLFEKLKTDFPQDPLVNLHYGRIIAGILSATIVLAEK